MDQEEVFIIEYPDIEPGWIYDPKTKTIVSREPVPNIKSPVSIKQSLLDHQSLKKWISEQDEIQYVWQEEFQKAQEKHCFLLIFTGTYLKTISKDALDLEDISEGTVTQVKYKKCVAMLVRSNHEHLAHACIEFVNKGLKGCDAEVDIDIGNAYKSCYIYEGFELQRRNMKFFNSFLCCLEEFVRLIQEMSDYKKLFIHSWKFQRLKIVKNHENLQLTTRGLKDNAQFYRNGISDSDQILCKSGQNYNGETPILNPQDPVPNSMFKVSTEPLIIKHSALKKMIFDNTEFVWQKEFEKAQENHCFVLRFNGIYTNSPSNCDLDCDLGDLVTIVEYERTVAVLVCSSAETSIKACTEFINNIRMGKNAELDANTCESCSKCYIYEGVFRQKCNVRPFVSVVCCLKEVARLLSEMEAYTSLDGGSCLKLKLSYIKNAENPKQARDRLIAIDCQVSDPEITLALEKFRKELKGTDTSHNSKFFKIVHKLSITGDAEYKPLLNPFSPRNTKKLCSLSPVHLANNVDEELNRKGFDADPHQRSLLGPAIAASDLNMNEKMLPSRSGEPLSATDEKRIKIDNNYEHKNKSLKSNDPNDAMMIRNEPNQKDFTEFVAGTAHFEHDVLPAITNQNESKLFLNETTFSKHSSDMMFNDAPLILIRNEIEKIHDNQQIDFSDVSFTKDAPECDEQETTLIITDEEKSEVHLSEIVDSNAALKIHSSINLMKENDNNLLAKKDDNFVLQNDDYLKMKNYGLQINKLKQSHKTKQNDEREKSSPNDSYDKVMTGTKYSDQHNETDISKLECHSNDPFSKRPLVAEWLPNLNHLNERAKRGPPDPPLITKQNNRNFIHYLDRDIAVRESEVDGIRKVSIGKKSSEEKGKVIVLLGATGSGKTTLVNLCANYYFGAQSAEEEKLFIVASKGKTDRVTVYTFYPDGENQMPLTVIDTPGLNDSTGAEIHDHIDALKSFLALACAQGLEINALGFVAQAHLVRLTSSEKLVLNFVKSFFGADVETSILALVTFADNQSTPPVVEAMEQYGFKTPYFFKFNNTLLISSNEEADELDKIYWRTGIKNWKKCIKRLFLMTPLSNATMSSMQNEILCKYIYSKCCINLQSEIRYFITMCCKKKLICELYSDKDLLRQRWIVWNCANSLCYIEERDVEDSKEIFLLKVCQVNFSRINMKLFSDILLFLMLDKESSLRNVILMFVASCVKLSNVCDNELKDKKTSINVYCTICKNHCHYKMTSDRDNHVIFKCRCGCPRAKHSTSPDDSTARNLVYIKWQIYNTTAICINDEISKYSSHSLNWRYGDLLRHLHYNEFDDVRKDILSVWKTLVYMGFE